MFSFLSSPVSPSSHLAVVQSSSNNRLSGCSQALMAINKIVEPFVSTSCRSWQLWRNTWTPVCVWLLPYQPLLIYTSGLSRSMSSLNKQSCSIMAEIIITVIVVDIEIMIISHWLWKHHAFVELLQKHAFAAMDFLEPWIKLDWKKINIK